MLQMVLGQVRILLPNKILTQVPLLHHLLHLLILQTVQLLLQVVNLSQPLLLILLLIKPQILHQAVQPMILLQVKPQLQMIQLLLKNLQQCKIIVQIRGLVVLLHLQPHLLQVITLVHHLQANLALRQVIHQLLIPPLPMLRHQTLVLHPQLLHLKGQVQVLLIPHLLHLQT